MCRTRLAQGSNLRPLAPEASALSAELARQYPNMKFGVAHGERKLTRLPSDLLNGSAVLER